jgi:Arylsulfotransferase (ASST)/Bacterial Ig domain/Carbohydrate binding domain
MATYFSSNELVTVTLNPQTTSGASDKVKPYEYQFMVTGLMPGSLPTPMFASSMQGPAIPPADEDNALGEAGPSPAAAAVNTINTPVILPNGVSVPSDFPSVVITVNNNPSPGYLFIGTGYNSNPAYTMILGNNGLPVWYRRGGMTNFQIQRNGIITWTLPDASGIAAFDQNFNYIKNYFTVNGYLPDTHDLKVLKDGSYLMLGYRSPIVDLSKYFSWGTIQQMTEGVIQEFTAAGELIFQWRAWDHYDIRLSGGDFPHFNALDVDDDGQILVSARHLSEVTKINRDTGDIIWRLSGANSSFTFVNDPLNGTSYQHDISALGNGHYMVFDNGNYHNPPVSRAVEYQLDLTNMTAKMVWQFRDTPDKYAFYQGSAQRLPNGNTLINFVMPYYPKATEVDTNGVKHFELNLVPSASNYRTFRFPWHGVVSVPYLIAEPQKDNITLIFNKFGDTNVAYYCIYGGTSPQPTNLLATSTTTLKRLANLTNGQRYYFRVTAVDRQGVESGFSNEENLTVNIIKAGEQMITNGDFSQGANWWTWAVSGGASAQWQVTNGVSCFDIVNGGSALASLQLRQTGKPLIQGKKYVFEFDAWSQAPRYIEAMVGQAASPYTDYSKIGLTYLTPIPTHFRYEFAMEEASDFNSSVMFNLGSSTSDVFLDNVSLVNPLPVANPQTITLDEDTSASFVLTAADSGSENPTFEIASLPAHGTLEGTAPNLTYKPVSNYFGPDEFTFKVNDGLVESAPATVSITVKPVNEPPVARIDVSPLAVFPGITNLVVISPLCASARVVLDGSRSSDVDNDPLEFAWLNGTNIVGTTQTVTNEFGPGSYEITLVVSDGQVMSTASVALEVITPADAVRVLMLLVEEAGLESKQATPLLTSLRAAAASFDRCNRISGVNQLGAFQNKVRAQISPLKPALAQQFTDTAQEVMACP